MHTILMSEATTKFKKYDINRNTNIYLAASAIDGYIVMPGDEFSFNNVVGERTVDKGYMLAESIDNKKIVRSIGGGICQVSTTLHMAAKNAGLKITEVHAHSRPVSYASREDESAVEWDELDFRFINNKNTPIEIKVAIDKNAALITVYIYSIAY